MHWRHKPTHKRISEWIHDAQILNSAYKKMENDILLNAEIRRLRFEYMKKYLVDMVGEDNTERILHNHGYLQ